MAGSTQPREEYAKRRAERQRALEKRRGTHLWLGNLRMAGFFGLLALAYAAFSRDMFSAWWLLVPVVLLIIGGKIMERVETELALLEGGVAFYDRALDRLDGRWAGRGATGTRFQDEHHLYASDLDILGEAS